MIHHCQSLFAFIGHFQFAMLVTTKWISSRFVMMTLYYLHDSVSNQIERLKKRNYTNQNNCIICEEKERHSKAAKKKRKEDRWRNVFKLHVDLCIVDLNNPFSIAFWKSLTLVHQSNANNEYCENDTIMNQIFFIRTLNCMCGFFSLNTLVNDFGLWIVCNTSTNGCAISSFTIMMYIMQMA